MFYITLADTLMVVFFHHGMVVESDGYFLVFEVFFHLAVDVVSPMIQFFVRSNV